MAGNLYRSGQQAVTDIRETYAQTRGRGMDGGDFDTHGSTHIPGAFPDVAITSQGDEQMVLFPCYAKRHVKREWTQPPEQQPQPSQPQAPNGGLQDEEYWRQEWERHEDEKAIVDVDIRGWIYSPNTGPMTRRNRLLIGLARQLSGISAPRSDQNYGSGGAPEQQPSKLGELSEQEKIAREAAKIERRGQEEKRIATRGGYSEQPQEVAGSFGESIYPPRSLHTDTRTPDSTPGSPTLLARQPSANVNELSETELVLANANLMARVAPFMTNPLVALPITVFFYNATKSQSRTVLTNDAGHFVIRAPLDFVPTHVRVLANEKLSAVQEIKIIEPFGVSLISDIDDTIKMSNILGGAREIFRNTFVRELADLSIEGVKEWYSDMHAMGVSIHYCSNSPWQLFPMLATFFKLGGLPPGSLHLKQYSGMLQGIFEPVAERKKGTLTRLLKDFPHRKFLLVGDSGEADLEVYTELAMANPGRVLAVFIRDVTTPEGTGYFEQSFDMSRHKASSMTMNDGRSVNAEPKVRQNSAPGPINEGKAPVGPMMGTLIDFSDEPEEMKLDDAATLEQVKDGNLRRSTTAGELLARKPPPPRPTKPVSLRSTPSLVGATSNTVGLGLSGVKVSQDADQAPPKPPRKPVGSGGGNHLLHPLSQIQNSSQQSIRSGVQSTQNEDDAGDRPPPPPPRRRATPSNLKNLSPPMFNHGRGASSNSDVDFDPLPPSVASVPATGMTYYRSSSRSGATSPSASPTLGAQGVNRKLELWRRRVARAHEQLDQLGVSLYTWRKGQDVEVEALAIVKQTLDELEQETKKKEKSVLRKKKPPAPPPKDSRSGGLSR